MPKAQPSDARGALFAVVSISLSVKRLPIPLPHVITTEETAKSESTTVEKPRPMLTICAERPFPMALLLWFLSLRTIQILIQYKRATKSTTKQTA